MNDDIVYRLYELVGTNSSEPRIEPCGTSVIFEDDKSDLTGFKGNVVAEPAQCCNSVSDTLPLLQAVN